jgi:hypothetical protein
MTVDVDTKYGPARVHLQSADEPRAALVLGHGAAGGVSAPDLVAASDAALAEGLSVALVEQPYRVAGRRSPAPAKQLDAAWTSVVDHLRAPRTPRAPARRGRTLPGSARRVPDGLCDRRGRRALPRLSSGTAPPFRLGREQAAGARRGDRPRARRAGHGGSIRHAAGRPRSHGGAGPRESQPEDGPGRSGRGSSRLAPARRDLGS